MPEYSCGHKPWMGIRCNECDPPVPRASRMPEGMKGVDTSFIDAAFRSLAQAEVAMPRNGSISLASRMEIPWHLVVRRKVQDILAMKPSKKEKEKEETR